MKHPDSEQPQPTPHSGEQHIHFYGPVEQSIIGGTGHIQNSTRAHLDHDQTVLYPSGLIPLADPWHIDWSQRTFELEICKLGPGMVDTICGALLPPLSPKVKTLSERYYLWLAPLFRPEESKRLVTMTQAGLWFSQDTCIEGYTFAAPPVPSYLEMQGGAPYVVARLTLTCHDIIGGKHASIYDYHAFNGWQRVAFMADIPADIPDLDAQARRRDRPSR